MDKIDYRVHGRLLGVIWDYLWYMMVEVKVFNDYYLTVEREFELIS